VLDDEGALKSLNPDMARELFEVFYGGKVVAVRSR